MNWQYTPLVLPLVAAVIVSAGLALYAWRRRPTVGGTPFALLMLGVAVWVFGEALRLVSLDLPAKFFWARTRYLGIVVVPATWLAFGLQYTNRGRWLTPRTLALLAIEPVVVLLLAWTNERHHWFWSDVRLEPGGSMLVWSAPHGVAFWIHTAYSYVLILLGTFLLIQALVRSPRLYRVQTGVLLVGAIAPVVGNVVSTFGPISFPVDLTPFGFVIAGLTVAWDIYRFQLFNIVPAARSAVVDSMSGGMLVLDMQNCIVDVNPAAEKIIGRPASDVLGQPARQVLSDMLDEIDRFRDVTEAHTEITLADGKTQRTYDLRISPLYDQSGYLSGRLIVLHDITEHKRAEADLTAQKQWFENLIAMARATAKHTSLEATLQSAVNMAATLTGAERGSMFLLDGTGFVTHSVLARGKATAAHRQSIVRDVMGEGLAGWVVRHRQPALVYDTTRDARWMDLPGTPPAGSAMAIPIVSGSAVLGVLTLTHTESNHFSPEHAYLIQASADQMMLAVRNAQMYDEQRRLADRQTTLYEALRAVGEHLDPETIARAAVGVVARLTGWPAVAILLPDESGSHLVVQAGAGTLSASQGQRLSLDLDSTGEQGITEQAFQTAQTQQILNVRAQLEEMEDSSVLRSKVAVPLRRGERVLGVLDVASDRPAAFNDDDVLLAKSLAEAIALALDNARLYAEIRQYAADLSALYNVARTISRSLVLEDVLSETLHAALTSLDFDIGIIGLTGPSDGQLHLAAELGLPVALSEQLRQEGMDGTLCAYVYSQGEAVAVEDIQQESPDGDESESVLQQMAPLAISEMSRLDMRAYAGIPLLHQERPIGTLSLFARQPRTLSTDEHALQMAIGQQIATAVTNAQLFQAVTDERGRLQALIESSRDGIILIGMDQHILVVNAPGIGLLRLTGQPEDWINRPVQDALTTLGRHAPDVVQVIQAEMHRGWTGDDRPGEGEWEIAPRTVHWLNLPVMAGKTPLGRLLVLRDVTEERSLERMRDDLIHAMVHDLRNPLTVISGSLSFLDEDIAPNLPANHLELWEIAKKSTSGMLELIKAILEISRLESQQMPLEHTLISLSDLANSALDSQLPLAAEKGVLLEGDVPSTLPPAWADVTLIRRVLKNLISNAIKFTPADGVVRVMARVDPEEHSRLLVSVSDTGSGIPPEVQDRLFQKFVTGRQEGHGSGLGLAFCKMVIESHGDRIWLESTSEGGTTFAFGLPLPPVLES